MAEVSDSRSGEDITASFPDLLPSLHLPGAIDGGKWLEYITANRAALEADWEILAPQRRWWAELNAFERLGDLTPPRWDFDIISFRVWRTLSQHSCAIASLQALDNQGDAAIALVQRGRQVPRHRI